MREQFKTAAHGMVGLIFCTYTLTFTCIWWVTLFFWIYFLFLFFYADSWGLVSGLGSYLIFLLSFGGLLCYNYFVIFYRSPLGG